MTWGSETVYLGMWQGLGGEGGGGLGVRTNPTWDVNIEVMENKLPWENFGRLPNCQFIILEVSTQGSWSCQV